MQKPSMMKSLILPRGFTNESADNLLVVDASEHKAFAEGSNGANVTEFLWPSPKPNLLMGLIVR